MGNCTNNRDLVLFGAGNICNTYLIYGFQYAVKYIIDNDVNKDGKEMHGIPIVSFAKVKDWKNIFIVVTSNYYHEISRQLESIGLKEELDFVSHRVFFDSKYSLNDIREAAKNAVFKEKEESEREVIVRNYSEYLRAKESAGSFLTYENLMGNLIYKRPGRLGYYMGYCECCDKEQPMIIDYVWSNGVQPAWRETVACSQCFCNSRMRFVVDYISRNKGIKDIFIYERVTGTYAQLKKKIPTLMGSEYLGNQYKSGDYVNEIMHQDALNLSFKDQSFEYMVSNDVFEHVADYKKAFEEAYRCLKENGHLVMSIPIFKDREKTIVRTTLNSDGSLNYCMPAVYHGNPISEEGSLVFTEFGWDVIESLLNCGFRDAYAVVYFSEEKGYFGDAPIIFEAIK